MTHRYDYSVGHLFYSSLVVSLSVSVVMLEVFAIALNSLNSSRIHRAITRCLASLIGTLRINPNDANAYLGRGRSRYD
jgi:hypothetical protein